MTIARHLLRELYGVLLLVLTVLLAASVGGRLLGYLEDAAGGKVPVAALWPILLLRLPEFLQVLLPLALALAVIVVVSRACADHEWTILQAAGLSPLRLHGLVAVGCLPVAAMVAALSLWLTPMANAALATTLVEARRAASFEHLPARRFVDFGSGRVARIGSVDARTRALADVFIGERDEAGQAMAVVRARHGRPLVDASTGSRFLLLEDGVRSEVGASDSALRVVRFRRLAQRIERAPAAANVLAAEATPTDRRLLATGRGVAELGWRLSLPLTTLLAAVMAGLLAPPPLRGSRTARFVIAVVPFVACIAGLLLARDLVARDRIGGGVAFGVVQALSIAAVVLLARFRLRAA